MNAVLESKINALNGIKYLFPECLHKTGKCSCLVNELIFKYKYINIKYKNIGENFKKKLLRKYSFLSTDSNILNYCNMQYY